MISVRRFLRMLFRRRRPATGDLHVFVRVRGKGLAWLGTAKDSDEASDIAQVEMAKIVMESGEVIFADWWTTQESELNRVERSAIAAYEAAAAAAPASQAPGVPS